MSPAKRFIDIHQHILYGMDDGPANSRGMRDMLDAAARDGVGVIVATPHIYPGKREFDRNQFHDALREANAYCLERGHPVRVLGGSEILYTESTVRLLQCGRIPTLNETRFVLIEWREREAFDSIIDGIRAIANAGFVPVIAHIERLRSMWDRADGLAEAKSAFEMRIQADCDAVLKKPFGPARNFLSALFRKGLVDYVASDAHNTTLRKTRMMETYRILSKKYGCFCADAWMRANPSEAAGVEI